MQQEPGEFSTSHTPGSGTGSGSGSAPLRNDASSQGDGSPGISRGEGGAGSSFGAGSSTPPFADRPAGSTGAASTTGGTGGGFADTARTKAGEWKKSVADRLESAAERLESSTGAGRLAGDGGVAGDVALVSDQGRLKQMGGALAGGMRSTADWVRDADLEAVKEGIERQVREHPARSLLIALGVGYLIGKAVRK